MPKLAWLRTWLLLILVLPTYSHPIPILGKKQQQQQQQQQPTTIKSTAANAAPAAASTQSPFLNPHNFSLQGTTGTVFSLFRPLRPSNSFFNWPYENEAEKITRVWSFECPKFLWEKVSLVLHVKMHCDIGIQLEHARPAAAKSYSQAVRPSVRPSVNLQLASYRRTELGF